ncbi:MAG: deoxyribodipyrimidine photo-lyase [Acidobacteriota bacterium]|nr:MAG: deoxyribodipyrimidine photo-lyase [Acidobacteriota bacterium]
MSSRATLVWLRQDLRVGDNPALRAALDRGASVIPVYVWSAEEEQPWSPGAASRWWLDRSLHALDEQLRRRESRLTIAVGSAEHALLEIARQTGADAVFWNRRYEPTIVERDKQLKTAVQAAGLEARSFNGALLFEPWEVRTGDDKPYRVFTPFWRRCLSRAEPDKPLPAPRELPAPERWPSTLEIDDLGLLPRIDWAEGLRHQWSPGEVGARRQLERFVGRALRSYDDDRNRPDLDGSSRLSPFLHFGELSPRQVWHAVRNLANRTRSRRLRQSAEAYLRQIGWREFAHHLLYHFPHTPEAPLREEFSAFPWRRDQRALRAWQRGRTGYPLVDAGMRELWTTGWMHNRVRMVVASFLVKDLLIDWQRGAAWFWDTLVDADLANNTLGWQWTAGCGADAALFFSVFNPVAQSHKFDPDAKYIARWLPELSRLPAKLRHEPWKATASQLCGAGLSLGSDYPRPVTDHGEARRRALDALESTKR